MMKSIPFILLLLVLTSCGGGGGGSTSSTRLRIINVYKFATEAVNLIQRSTDGTEVETPFVSSVAVGSHTSYRTVSNDSFFSGNTFSGLIRAIFGNLSTTVSFSEPRDFSYSLILFENSCITFDRITFQCIPGLSGFVTQDLQSSANPANASLRVTFAGVHFSNVDPIGISISSSSNPDVIETELSSISSEQHVSGYLDFTPGTYTVKFSKPIFERTPREVSVDVELSAGGVTEVIIYDNPEGQLEVKVI